MFHSLCRGSQLSCVKSRNTYNRSRLFGIPKHSQPSQFAVRFSSANALNSVHKPGTENPTDTVHRLQDVRYITFPDTRKGRIAKLEAYEHWASFWRTIPAVDKPLTFKIDDRDGPGVPNFSNVTREGITFTKGNAQAERYWRLTHPISWSARLHQIRWRLSAEYIQALPWRLRCWLYGGPSLSLPAKLQWLVSGPSQHPWLKRSRWVRWPVYALLVYIFLAAVVVFESIKQAPLTGRWYFDFLSKADYLSILERDRSGVLADLPNRRETYRAPNRQEMVRLGNIYRRLLEVCGLGGTKWSLRIVDDPGKYPV